MLIEKNKQETILRCNEDTISDFFIVFKEKYPNFKNANIIIDFSDLKGVETEKILLLLHFSENHRNNGMSFVIVVKGIDFDSLPDEIIAVPTLIEAKDIIEMETIERDLGF